MRSKVAQHIRWLRLRSKQLITCRRSFFALEQEHKELQQKHAELQSFVDKHFKVRVESPPCLPDLWTVSIRINKHSVDLVRNRESMIKTIAQDLYYKLTK